MAGEKQDLQERYRRQGQHTGDQRQIFWEPLWNFQGPKDQGEYGALPSCQEDNKREQAPPSPQVKGKLGPNVPGFAHAECV